jgi:hypothetical protein
VVETSKGVSAPRAFSWWPVGIIALATIGLLYALWSFDDVTGNPGGGGGPEMEGLSSRIRGPEIEPAGWFIYLVDVSGSTRVGARRRRRNPEAIAERDTPYTRALGLISQSVLGLRKLTEALPQRHSVIAITSASLYQKPLCEITVPKVNLFTGADTVSMVHSIEQCDSTLRNIRWSTRTDIRGAIKLAGLVLEQKPGKVRGIILISDLEETLRPGQEPAVPSLHGECVLLVPQITPALARTPSLLDKRVESWRQQVLDWGASRVSVRSVPAFSPGDVVRFFRECGKGQ